MKKVTMNFDEQLLSDIQEYADKMHINRSAAISVMCSEFLKNQKLVSTLDEMMTLVKQQKSISGLSPSSGLSIDE